MTFKRLPGRPAKYPGFPRKMRFTQKGDDFFAQRKKGLSRTKTALAVECALAEFKRRPPKVRDRFYRMAGEHKRISSAGRGVESARSRAAVPKKIGSVRKSRTRKRWPSNLEY